MAEAPLLPPPGSTFHYLDYKYHIVGYIRDGEETVVVVKYFGKHRRWWHYEVWTEFEAGLKIKQN